MEGTRASLAEKLDTLENHVLGSVQEATSAVSHTVEDVKSAVGSVTDTIQETVENVKHAFDLREHVRHHPWASLGGAAAVGFLGGYLLGPSRSGGEAHEEPTPSRRREESTFAREVPTPRWAEPPAPPSPPSSSEEEGLLAPLKSLKGLAIGTLMNLVRDFVSRSLPDNVKPDVLNLVDDFTVRLGGKPLHGSDESQGGEGDASTAGGQANGHRGTSAGTPEGEESTGRQDRRRASSRRR